MLKAGIIRVSDSPFSSPAMLVKKASSGEYRFVVDYRRLNRSLMPTFYPIPSLEHCFDMIGNDGSTIFCLIDQKAPYHNLKLDESSRRYTAFTTPRGAHYEFTRLAQGIRSSPTAFITAMSRLLHSDLTTNGVIYLDDLLIFHRTWASQKLALASIFHKFRVAKLRINPQKCYFAVGKVIFLGFEVSAEGIKIDPKRFDGVKSFPAPTNIKELRRWLGVVGYLRKFLKGFSKITFPLRQLLIQGTPWNWGAEQ